jgi:CheY-like chemotaxis protein
LLQFLSPAPATPRQHGGNALINMPGMDGLQLLGEIKQRRPDLPVMMVTAYGDDERRRRSVGGA